MHMKKKWANLSELKRLLIIWGLVSFVLIAASSIGIFFGQPGWIIGVTLGSLIELINIILLLKGTTEILRQEKPGLFLLFYALRMILFVGVILTLVLLQYKANIEFFTNSFWGALIGYTPMQIIVVVISLRNKMLNERGANR